MQFPDIVRGELELRREGRSQTAQFGPILFQLQAQVCIVFRGKQHVVLVRRVRGRKIGLFELGWIGVVLKLHIEVFPSDGFNRSGNRYERLVGAAVV